jgi:hypothetical protein
MNAAELLRGDGPFVADTSAWWRFARLPTGPCSPARAELRTVRQKAK